MKNTECKRFAETQCPPGFDCTQKICQELATCLADADCISLVPGQTGTQVTGYCEESHCQPSAPCVSDAECAEGKTCIAKVCVPSVCRGHLDCGSDKSCVDGKCVTAPAAKDIDSMRLSPTNGLLVEGDTLTLHLIVSRIDGSTSVLEEANFEITDATGLPSTAATVSATGQVTAVTAGEVRIRANVTGSTLRTNEVHLTIIPSLMMGRRLIVVDPASQKPIEGVLVRACSTTACETPLDVTTDTLGIAAFPLLDAAAITFTAVPVELRSDGRPLFERASILETTVADVMLPLRENPVHFNAGFSASVSFTNVSTTGAYWAGFVTASISDVLSATPQGLLGENFTIEIPGVGQTIPAPGALVLYTSPGLGIPQPIKPRSLAFAQPSTGRFVQAWAGRTFLESTLALRSIDVLSYLGAFDYAQLPDIAFTPRLFVADVSDVDGDGLCSNAQRCPTGVDDVPDYANFTPLSFQPSRQQKLRTEVVLPSVAADVDTVVLASILIDERAGMLPTGFASKTPGAAGADGQRPVEPTTLRGGSAYNGLETAGTGLWALAGNAAGTSLSGRIHRSTPLSSKVLIVPFLPTPAQSAYSPEDRSVNLGQPAWASIFSAGAELGRVAITGSDTRHVVYFAMSNAQTALAWPSTPLGPGKDPAAEATFGLEVVAVDLKDDVTVDQLFDASGVTLSSWPSVVDGYSRLDR